MRNLDLVPRAMRSCVLRDVRRICPSPSEGRQNENHNHSKLTKLNRWNTALSSSMKLWAMLGRATQDSHVMAEIKLGPLQYSCLESILAMNSMKRQKDRTLKDELPRSVGAQYATWEEWRNNSRKDEEMEPKQKQHPAVDMIGDGSKVRCCKNNIA